MVQAAIQLVFLSICIIAVHSNGVHTLLRDPTPQLTGGCKYQRAHMCYVNALGKCAQWCAEVADELKTNYGYIHGCRYGNYQNVHSYCRGGREKMSCQRCDNKFAACCGTCKQDCDVDLNYAD
ncbi:hypothetical protein SNE40_001788 [Patella caerulea]|uniref:Secreted protein n=1 Tax=Patella caerulea TaxID=87958 RepID=A0AAN8K4M9_PATCE